MPDKDGHIYGLIFVMMGMMAVFYAIAAIAIVVALIAAFTCFVFTILALLAWNGPLKLGKIVIEPAEAREFIYRGLAGAVLVPAFAFLCAVLFQEPGIIPFLGYLALAGYVLGSLGLEYWMGQVEPDFAGQPQAPHGILPPEVQQRALPPTQSAPFRYASWDDEEANGQ